MWVPNTLADLTKRENRFAHTGTALNIGAFPWAMDTSRLRFINTTNNPLWPLEDDRQGEDVMLNDVLAFDLRVYDPGAPLYAVSSLITEPSDAGWTTGGTKQGFGAYVDLGWLPAYTWNTATEPPARFSLRHQAGWHPRLPNASPLNNYPAVYDTWPYHYEGDGLDQDGDGVDSNGDGNLDTLVDEGTDGLDTDNANGRRRPRKSAKRPRPTIPPSAASKSNFASTTATRGKFAKRPSRGILCRSEALGAS